MKLTFEQLRETAEYRAAEEEYDACVEELGQMSKDLGLRPWDLGPWTALWRNPHEPGSEAYESMQAIRERGLKLMQRRRKAGDRKGELERAAGFGGPPRDAK